MLDKRHFEKQWQEEFAKAARNGGEDHQISYWSKEGLEAYVKYFFEYFESHIQRDNSQALLLDLGCGPGTFSKLLFEKGFKVFAVDYAAEMIEVAKKRSYGEAINYQVADIYKLPFSDDYFDFIICLGVFQDVERPLEAIQEMRRTLKKDGLMIITTLNKFSLSFLFRRKKRSEIFLRKYNPYFLKKTFSKQGLYNVKLKGIYLTPFVFLTNLVLKLKLCRFFNLFFPVFICLAHSFHLEGRKK